MSVLPLSTDRMGRWPQHKIESMLESILQYQSVRKEIYAVHLDSNPVLVCTEVVTLGVETRSCFTEILKRDFSVTS